MRVLVTGGAGFIGSAVVRELVGQGHQPVVLDSLRSDVHGAELRGPNYRPEEAVPDGIELIAADVRDPEAVTGALTGIDVVAHLAAKVGLGVDLDDLDDYVSSNDLGTAVLLKALAQSQVRRLVLAGSMVVYGEGSYRCAQHGDVAAGPRRAKDLADGRFEPPCPKCGRQLAPGLVYEEALPDPRNGYAATKLHQEHLAAVWARETGGTAASMRFHNVYGPGMPRNTPYAGVAAVFRSALERGETIRVLEDGEQRRDFVHVQDVARAVVAAARAGAEAPPFRAYNVGSGRVTTIGQLASGLAAVMGGPEPVVTGGYRLGDVRHITASSDRAARELHWRAEIPFADGLAEFAATPVPAA